MIPETAQTQSSAPSHPAQALHSTGPGLGPSSPEQVQSPGTLAATALAASTPLSPQGAAGLALGTGAVPPQQEAVHQPASPPAAETTAMMSVSSLALGTSMQAGHAQSPPRPSAVPAAETHSPAVS